jgi:hypothetical protein
MRRMWWLRGLRFALFAILVLAVIGVVVMVLWNALMPVLFGWPPIGFWQSLGLLLLSRILVGGLRGGYGGRMHWRARMADRWAAMSDEERAQFREGMRHRCGRSEPGQSAAGGSSIGT